MCGKKEGTPFQYPAELNNTPSELAFLKFCLLNKYLPLIIHIE